MKANSAPHHSLIAEARGVGFRYPSGRKGLEPLDLTLASGEVVVVMGPNGSGKSTLVRLLATDLAPTSGTLHLFGSPSHPPRPALRRRIGYGPDQPVHLSPLTGRENVRFFEALSGRPEGSVLLEPFRLHEVADVPVAEYSFGMKRKLLLAQLLGPGAELVLLDEPTVGLDPGAIEALGDSVRARAAEGAVLVMASNDLRHPPRWATRIVFLHEGRVVADAPPSELEARIPGGTRFEVRLDGPIPPLPQLPGVRIVEAAPTLLRAESSRGSGPLPDLLTALLDGGCHLSAIRVREPDLGDLFRELTGAELDSPAPAGDGPALHDGGSP